MIFFDSVRNFYGRFERPISSLSLVLGFVFDALTLRRVDTLFENLWILGHLIIIGVFIALIHIKEKNPGDEKNPHKAHFWYVNILQFFFGGTLSAYLVFYFRSADIFASWPFVALLVLAFWANESFKRHYIRFSFQVTLFFLSIYSFMIFLLPILTKSIGAEVFLLSGGISLVLILLFMFALFYITRERFSESKRLVLSLIFSIFILVNFFYFTNLIPPIPLSLKDAGVYHSIKKNSEGNNYEVTYEDYGWRGYFKLYPDFKKTESSTAYVYSAIFSPKNLNINIIHEWQHYKEDTKEWVTASIVKLPVVGGREGGFRTYSVRSSLEAGKWRVNIETENNKSIGHVRFNVVPVTTPPEVASMIK